MSDEAKQGHEEMNNALLNLSSQLFTTDPLFHARCQITGAVLAYACSLTGEPMTRDTYAAVMQAAAVALVLARVDDEELSESVDHGKVLVSMLDFERVQSNLKADRAKEEEKGE